MAFILQVRKMRLRGTGLFTFTYTPYSTLKIKSVYPMAETYILPQMFGRRDHRNEISLKMPFVPFFPPTPTMKYCDQLSVLINTTRH